MAGSTGRDPGREGGPVRPSAGGRRWRGEGLAGGVLQEFGLAGGGADGAKGRRNRRMGGEPRSKVAQLNHTMIVVNWTILVQFGVEPERAELGGWRIGKGN